jgi:hypothetical protein
MITSCNGVVDEETQKNNLDIVREVLNVTREAPIEREQLSLALHSSYAT